MLFVEKDVKYKDQGIAQRGEFEKKLIHGLFARAGSFQPNSQLDKSDMTDSNMTLGSMID